ncbi:MAG: CBM20 domain-containing protein [Planctomycetota bacterium]
MSVFSTIKSRLFGSGRSIDLVVYVPPETPSGEAVYVSGACSKLGEWDPSGLRLKQVDHGVWQRRISVPGDQPVEFKVTRGSWETVERAADGGDAGNHWVEPSQLADGVIRHEVQRWVDVG